MDLGLQLNLISQRLDRLERASRLSHASIENTAIQVNDGNGSLRAIVGQQPDGTTAVNVVNGPPPPQPSPPIVASVLGGVTVSWDGTFTDGSVLPLDWARVEVHASPLASYTPGPATLRDTVETAQGATIVVPCNAPVYVQLVARNTSGNPSPASTTVGPLGPTTVVADDVRDGIITTVKLADDAVTQAKVAVAAIDSTALADAAVTAQKIGDAAVGTGQLAIGAVTTAKLAAGAVTASQIAANTITAGNMAANSVTATQLAAGSVQTAALATDSVAAGKIAANAVTAREIQASSITGDRLAANTITAGQIQAGAIDATALSATAITGKTISGGTITGTTITGGLIRTASSGERIALNEGGVNKFLVYNSSNVAINELSARGLLVQGTNGAVIWVNPNTTYPQIKLYNAGITNAAIVQVSEGTTGDASLEQFCGPFSGNGFSDMTWRTVHGRDSAAIERLRASDPNTTRIGGRLYLNETTAFIGIQNTTDTTKNTQVTAEANYVHVDNARMQVAAPASSNAVLYASAATGHTGTILRAGINGSDKFTVDKDGTTTITGLLNAASIATGTVSITPSAASTPTSMTVTFPTVPGTTFRGYATANSTVPGVRAPVGAAGVTGVAVSSVSATSMVVWVNRENTSATNINWMVIGS